MRTRSIARLVTAAALSAVFACSLAVPGIAGEDLSLEERARIQGYIALLDSDSGTDRTQAEAEIAKLGERARALLEASRAASKGEQRRRIDALLARIDEDRRTASADQWPGLRGGPQRSGVVGGTIPAKQPSLAWKVEIPDEQPLQGALIATNDAVVTLSADGTVRCLSSETGARRWIAVLDAKITASAVFAAGRIVVPTESGVSALSADDGREVWKITSEYGCRAAPAVVGNRVYLALRNHGVRGVDLRTGEQFVERKFAPQGALLADTDLLVTGGEDGDLRSIDPESGKDRWKVDLGGAPVMGPTLAAPGVILVMSKDRTMQALRTSDGGRIWMLRSATLSPSESISAAAGRVFTTDTAGFLRAFDAATGRELWNRCEGFTEMGAPAATGEAVCFASRGRIGCRDAATGDFLWRIDVDRRDCSSPVVAAGRVFVLDAGQLRCLK